MRVIQVLDKLRKEEKLGQEIIDDELLNDTNIIQAAIDHCLEIKSFLCIEFIFEQLTELKIEPMIGIQALSEVIQELYAYDCWNSTQFKMDNQISLSNNIRNNVRKFEYISNNQPKFT